MKIEDSKLSDWFEEWYKKLQHNAPNDLPESVNWIPSALDLMNKMLTRMQHLETICLNGNTTDH
jgi:hypothetical protein